MKERDAREITEELLEKRENGETVIALRPVMLDGDLPRGEKEMPPGAVFKLAPEEYKRLSKPQRPEFVTDTSEMRRKLRASGRMTDKQIDAVVESQEDLIRTVRSQVGGKQKLEVLKWKAGPAVKKTNKRPSTRQEIKALQKEWRDKQKQEITDAINDL